MIKFIIIIFFTFVFIMCYVLIWENDEFFFAP